MRAIDTNVLVQLIARDDAVQTESAEASVTREAWVSHVVLVETAWVLDSVYGLGHAQIAVAIEMVLSHRDLILQDPDVVQAALAHYRKRPKLGFSDCMVLEIFLCASRINPASLATIDPPGGEARGRAARRVPQ